VVRAQPAEPAAGGWRRVSWVLLVAVAAVAPLGCGGDDGGGNGDLVWVGTPRISRASTLPRDRVLNGFIRNDGLRRLTIEAKDVRAVDRGGTALRSNATFIRGYVHPLYPPTRPPPGGLPDSERIRLGQVVRLEPGKQTHLSVAWRLAPGAKPPDRIDYGSGWLPIPGS
jgi:hypothetical protein